MKTINLRRRLEALEKDLSSEAGRYEGDPQTSWQAGTEICAS
jgi:hypothetical protein